MNTYARAGLDRAVRAGLTGVRVLSTLHSNDTASTIDVFRQFDIPPMFIADSVNCIISQRLLRKICSVSHESYTPDAAECAMLGVDPAQATSVQLVRGVPAAVNFHTGYAGRTGIFEVMALDSGIREAILRGKSSSELKALAVASGMQTLEQVAMAKVRAGQTTLEEMHRVLIVGA